jgi:hypothetical protein
VHGRTQLGKIDFAKPFCQGGPTMQRLFSIISQLLQLFPQIEFENAVKKHKSDYAAKGFSSLGQFVAMLVLRYLQIMSTFAWSLSNLVALLRHQLFIYRDLFGWLNEPFEGPPQLEDVAQAQLSFGVAF